MGKKEQSASYQIGRFCMLMTGGILSAILFTGCTTIQTSQGQVPRWGEYGGDMRLLQAGFQGPKVPGESNYYIDLTDMALSSMVASLGLTNNHALFVLAHGAAVWTDYGLRYAYYNEKNRHSFFSPLDLRRILGDKADQVRILVLAGCNTENMLYTPEFKQYFPNTTTIIHATPRTDASVAAFRQMLTYNSAQLGNQKVSGALSPEFGRVDTRATGPFIAQKFAPGSSKPYKQEVAGRELLTGMNTVETASSPLTNSALKALLPTACD